MRTAIVLLVGLALVLAVAGCGTKVAGVPSTVAKVNGAPIESSAYLNELNQQAGKQVLRGMIEQQIIMTWADKLGVSATDAQIEKQINTLKRDKEYEDRAKQVGPEALKKQMMIQQAFANIVNKLYKVTDDELEATFNSPGITQRFVHGPQKRLAAIVALDKKRLDEAASKLKEGKDFDEVATEYSVTGSAIKDWVSTEGQNLPPALLKAVKETGINQTSPVFSLGGQQYAIIRILGERGKQDLDLKDVKDEVLLIAAMQKAQMNPDFQKKLTDQKRKAKIDVYIEGFQSIIPQVKAPQQAPQMGGPGGPAPGQ